MTTKPYSELLAQVEALAGATLALAEQSRVKIFANRRAKQAHRESPYWPRFLRVGEERIVSSTGLLPLAEDGKDTIDQIIRIHATDPFKAESANEYAEYYHDSTGIQIAGYQLAESSYGADMLISGELNPDITGRYRFESVQTGRYGGEANLYRSISDSTYTIDPAIGDSGGVDIVSWFLGNFLTGNYWQLEFPELLSEAPSPAGLTYFEFGSATGTVTVTAENTYSAFVTYLAAPATTYGDGSGEEADIPEEWFEFMAQGAYCDWLRSDGQTEKALAEEAIAQMLLGQQLEKVSRQNGNQVITRQLNHANMQRR